jgi:NAD(P) transhydrogenase subunit alpha
VVIGILKEKEGENRVSVLPEIAAALIKLKAEVWIESNAGINAFEQDNDYVKTGCFIHPCTDVLSKADVLLSINPLQSDETAKMKAGAVLLGIHQPLFNIQLVHDCLAKNITLISLDMLPRTTRAQAMDVLSSQANIAGYKAVLLAASVYPHYFPMLMTAAGSVAPAKVLILGAGVAGLQAIATARRLGAVVEVFDTRPAAKEEVMSLGAKFIEVEGAADASKAGGYAVEQTEEYKQRQQQRISDAITKADIVITTAQIPGKRAPLLIPKTMVEGMKAGSVIIDLAASTGGNCELAKNNQTVMHHGVSIIGNSNLPSTVPSDASKMYGKNVFNFLKLLIDADGNLQLNFDDELIKGACITHQSKIINERISQMVQAAKN